MLGKPFFEVSKMHCDHDKGTTQFIDGIENITFVMPHKREELKDIEDLPVEVLRPFEIKDDKIDDDIYYNRKRTWYSRCMSLCPEYRRDEKWIKSFELARKLERKTQSDFESSYKTR